MWADDNDELKGCLEYTGQYFVQYSRFAVLHGIAFLSRRTAFERLLWGILTLFCLLLCASQIIKLCSRLYQSPVVVTFGTPASVYQNPFPAVTFCPETKTVQALFSYQKTKTKLEQGGNLTDEEKKKYEYLYAICNDEIFDESRTDYFEPHFFTHDFYETVEKLTTSFNQTMVYCAWLNVTTSCENMFTPVFIDEGICYSFNLLDRKHIFKEAAYTPGFFFNAPNDANDWTIEKGYKNSDDFGESYPQRVVASGEQHTLTVALAVYAEDFDTRCKSSMEGFRIIIHAPNEIPRGRHNFFRVSPNNSFSAAVNPTLMVTSPKVRQFHPRNRNCYKETEKPLKYFRTYTQENCLSECLSNYTLMRCDCVGYYMPRSVDVPVCGVRYHKCLYEAKNELRFLEVKHHLREKETKMPSFCDCLPSCTLLRYKVEVSQSASYWKELVSAMLEKHENLTNRRGAIVSQLKIYLKHDFIIKIERKQVYSTIGLISKIGGLVGLYVGASVVTIIEFIYFWSIRLICNKRLYGRWTGPELSDMQYYK